MADILNEIVEKDESGKITTTYVESSSAKRGETTRTDIIHAVQEPLWQQFVNIFLPAGYPSSVTEDYLKYQIYDSLQAFSSSIAGLLCSRAVLQGVGVGDSTASASGAVLVTIIHESVGRVATILFAHRLGTSLEPECKMYRLAADVFNDIAMVLDCISPMLPKTVRVAALSASSALRALCGVAAGSAKASLSAHFARWGNLGELNAKDASQETVIGLMGMLAGSVVVSRVTSTAATWTWLIILLIIHLATNYAAVVAVRMRTLNRQRANLVLSELFENDVVLTPEQVALQERVFERDGILRWRQSAGMGFATIGVPLRSILTQMIQNSSQETLTKLLVMYESEPYVLWQSEANPQQILIALKEDCTDASQLKAWAHALLLARGSVSAPVEDRVEHVAIAHEKLKGFSRILVRLRDHGWDVDTGALEVRSGYRFAAVKSKATPTASR